MLVLREGAGVGGPRLYCSGKDANVATDFEGGIPHHTHSEARGCSSAGERRGESCPPGPAPQGCPAPGPVHHTPVSQTVMLEVGGQRSVTLFSSAAAICWSRKASCIFCAAGSSSRALMILVGGLGGGAGDVRPQARGGGAR